MKHNKNTQKKIFLRSIIALSLSCSFFSAHAVAASCNSNSQINISTGYTISPGSYCDNDQSVIINSDTFSTSFISGTLDLQADAITKDVVTIKLSNYGDIVIGNNLNSSNSHSIQISATSENSTSNATYNASAISVENSAFGKPFSLNDSNVEVISGYATGAGAKSGNATGVLSSSGGLINLTNTDFNIVAANQDTGTSGGVAIGINAEKESSNVKLRGKNTFNITGGKYISSSLTIGAYGLLASDGANIDSAFANSTTTINMNGGSESRNNQIGVYSRGISAKNIGSNINLGEITINTDGTNSIGIKADSNGQVHLHGVTNISISGAGSTAILIDRDNDFGNITQSQVSFDPSSKGSIVDVVTKADKSIAFAIHNDKSVTSDDVIEKVSLRTLGKSSSIIDLSSSYASIDTHRLDINSSELSANYGVGINVNNTSGLEAINLVDTNLIMSEANSLAVVNNGAAKSRLVVDLDNSSIKGNIQGGGLDNRTTITLEGASEFTGAALNASKIEINDKDSTWNVTQNSSFATALNSNGIINILNGSTIKTVDFDLYSESNLNIEIGSVSPVITVSDIANLAGSLTISGFSSNYNGSSLPVKVSQIYDKKFTIIHANNGINRDFSTHSIGGGQVGVVLPGYLVQDAAISINKKDYDVGFLLAWDKGGQSLGNGDFNLESGTALDVDVQLSDQTIPSGGFASGWNGKDLNKLGDGLLRLSYANGYSGKTSINGGTLQTGVANAFAKSSDLIINTGAKLDLDSFDQEANRLSGNGGEITLGSGKLTVNNTLAGVDDTAFAGDISGTGGITKKGEGNLTLSGKTLWTGNTEINGGSLILDGSVGGGQLTSNVSGQGSGKLILQNNAILTGSVDPIDMSILSGSNWNVTGSSDVINLNNAGTINFVNGSTGRNINVAGDYLSNNGTIIFNVALGDDSSPHDLLVVQGSTSGKTTVGIRNIGGSGEQTKDGIELIQVNGASNAKFELANRVVAGAYDYQIYQGLPSANNGNWYLRSTTNYRPESGSYIANQISANSMFVHTLHERLGESLYSTDIDNSATVKGNVWARINAYHQVSKAGDRQLELNSNTSIVQVGTDLMRHKGASSLAQAGVMFSAGQSNNRSRNIDHNSSASYSDVNGYAVGLYGTWYAKRTPSNGGLYIDGSVQYGRYSNNIKGYQVSDQNYDSHNTIASLETGYAFALSSNPTNTWFIEPQAQVIYRNYAQDEIKEQNGTTVKAENTNFWTSRIGTRFYANKVLSNGIKIKPFIELNWLHNTNETAVNMGIGNSYTTVTSNFPKDRQEVKLGLESELNKKFTVWANAGYQSGTTGYIKVQGNMGIKYIW